jgi:hypothetical protein
VESKLHPFVSKKIVEVVGMEEDDLVNFILDFIRKHKGPDALVTELEVVKILLLNQCQQHFDSHSHLSTIDVG